MNNRDLPFVSIVIPLYNSASFLRRCLDSVLKTKYPLFEILLIDDLSTDETEVIVRDKYLKYKNIKYIKNKRKLLAAGSRNNGFKHAKGNYVALLDHDVEVDPYWILEMVKVMVKDKSIGVVQSKIFDYKKRNILQCVGVKIYPQVGWVLSVGQGTQWKKDFRISQDVVAAATGVMYVKRAFVESGGFDEKLGINLDDLDLNWRLWVIGYRTVVADKAITYHWSKVQRVRDAWISRFSWEFHYAKTPRVFLKNYSLIHVIHYLPMYLFIANIRAVFNILLRFNFSPLVGFWASMIWNIYYLPDTLSQRSKIKKMRKFNDSELMSKIFINANIFTIFIRYWIPTLVIGKKIATENMS